MISQYWPSALDFLANVNQDQLATALTELAGKLPADNSVAALETLRLELVNYKVMVPADVLQQGLTALTQQQISPAELAQRWTGAYRQVNPEYIVNLDFGAVVLMQIAISAYIQRWSALPVLVFGTLVLGASMVLGGASYAMVSGGSVVACAVILFALGEMIASPKSQEYVAAIAPRQKTAMFMGYYFVSMALGNLFAGLLSGWAYQTLARDMHQPLMMWCVFGAIGLVTAVAMIALNQYLRSRPASAMKAA